MFAVYFDRRVQGNACSHLRAHYNPEKFKPGSLPSAKELNKLMKTTDVWISTYRACYESGEFPPELQTGSQSGADAGASRLPREAVSTVSTGARCGYLGHL